MGQIRMTIPTLRVLQVLVGDPGHRRYGLEICREAELASGTVHPLLARLERIGWVESAWEDIDPRAEGRPARRYYWLTEEGAVQARRTLATDHRPRPWHAPATGGAW